MRTRFQGASAVGLDVVLGLQVVWGLPAALGLLTACEGAPGRVVECDGGARGDASVGCSAKSDSGLAPPILGRVAQPAGFAFSLADTAPADNPLTEAAASLGRRLFYDPVLSRDRTVSCANCHQQRYGFSDPARVSEGVRGQTGERNAPHLANLAWVRAGLFWDGRAATLEEQVLQPISNPVEMDLDVERAVTRLADDPQYVQAFEAAFGVRPDEEHLARALASFVRALVSTSSPYDRYLAGDSEALGASATRGLRLFFGERAECFHCHSEGTLTNDGYFNNGVFEEGGDIGRQELTGRSGDLGKFRVPSLRNVAVTAPYMHDGSLATLEDVVDHYADGGSGHPSTDVQIHPLVLTAEERADIVAFLESLTDREFLSAPELGPLKSP